MDTTIGNAINVTVELQAAQRSATVCMHYVHRDLSIDRNVCIAVLHCYAGIHQDMPSSWLTTVYPRRNAILPLLRYMVVNHEDGMSRCVLA